MSNVLKASSICVQSVKTNKQTKIDDSDVEEITEHNAVDRERVDLGVMDTPFGTGCCMVMDGVELFTPQSALGTLCSTFFYGL